MEHRHFELMIGNYSSFFRKGSRPLEREHRGARGSKEGAEREQEG